MRYENLLKDEFLKRTLETDRRIVLAFEGKLYGVGRVDLIRFDNATSGLAIHAGTLTGQCFQKGPERIDYPTVVEQTKQMVAKANQDQRAED